MGSFFSACGCRSHKQLVSGGREKRAKNCFARLKGLLWWWVGVGRAARAIVATLMTLHPLLALALHLVPLFLLIGIQHSANLIARGFVHVHHFGAAILL